jgi:hypothetical protein
MVYVRSHLAELQYQARREDRLHRRDTSGYLTGRIFSSPPDSVSAYATLLARATTRRPVANEALNGGFRRHAHNGRTGVPKRTFRPSASCSCCKGDQKKCVMTEPIVTNIADMGSTVRSFHGNCESQPVKQSR